MVALYGLGRLARWVNVPIDRKAGVPRSNQYTCQCEANTRPPRSAKSCNACRAAGLLADIGGVLPLNCPSCPSQECMTMSYFLRFSRLSHQGCTGVRAAPPLSPGAYEL